MPIVYQENVVKLDIASYRHYWRGEPKVGKTTLFRDLIIALYGNPKHGLLVSLGQETGYKALTNLYAHDCPTWSDWVETVEDLSENKENNEFKILALDTVDELIEMAEREVLRIHRAQKGESATSINAALGGYGAGKKKARSLVEDSIAKLERAGYGMIYIGHTKVKDVTEKATDSSYQVLTGSLEFAYDAIFSDRADIMAMMVSESNIKDERIKERKRYIYLRSTNFIDAGSRVKGLPEKVELSAESYISAIKNSLETTAGVDGKKAESQRKLEIENREQEAKKFIEQQKAQKVQSYGDFQTLKEYVDYLSEYVKSFSPETRAMKKDELTKKSLPYKFNEISDLETAKKVYAIVVSAE